MCKGTRKTGQFSSQESSATSHALKYTGVSAGEEQTGESFVPDMMWVQLQHHNQWLAYLCRDIPKRLDCWAQLASKENTPLIDFYLW